MCPHAVGDSKRHCGRRCRYASYSHLSLDGQRRGRLQQIEASVVEIDGQPPIASPATLTPAQLHEQMPRRRPKRRTACFQPAHRLTPPEVWAAKPRPSNYCICVRRCRDFDRRSSPCRGQHRLVEDGELGLVAHGPNQPHVLRQP